MSSLIDSFRSRARALRQQVPRLRIAAIEDRLLAWLARRAAEAGAGGPWTSSHDPLTGLATRTAFIERVRYLRQRNVAGAIAVVDVDHFKLVNDRHGHGVGDEVLRTLAARVQSTVTADVVVARLGGDELALFVPGEMGRARPLMDRLLDVLRQPVELPSATLTVSASIGLSPLPLVVPLDQGLSSADLAMYVAKGSGRGHVHVYGPETQGVVTARRELARTVLTLQERNQALLDQVQRDALTGLRSRRALDEWLGIECGGAQPGAEHYAVAFLDIDHFGHYNKHHGDAQGDQALRQVAQIIQATARRGDLVFRKGGEEMVVVLPGSSEEEARGAAERMRSAVQSAAIRHTASPTAPVVTVTVGVAASQAADATTIDGLMKRAAEAAMRAKLLARRNEVHVA